jgi:glycosyltransferase involved in cell wall biosynthesis
VALSGISEYQARQVTEGLGRELPVVYNGVEFGRFEPRYEKGEYLAFLGRMSFDKNPLDAIRIAKRAGMRIVVAGQPQQRKEEAYFETEIKPLIDGEQVRYIGPVNHEQKNELLRNAAALIFPVQWEEPFGLVMIEAMACGTPVLAHNLGSVGEVVTPGLTGFYAAEIEGMQELLAATLELDRRKVREMAEGRFSAGRMVEGYLEIYREIAKG